MLMLIFRFNHELHYGVIYKEQLNLHSNVMYDVIHEGPNDQVLLRYLMNFIKHNYELVEANFCLQKFQPLMSKEV